MQADLDYDVFKALTLLRKSEDDTINDVIRRLIEQPDDGRREGGRRKLFGRFGKRKADFSEILSEAGKEIAASGNEPERGGIWIANTHFPDGTRFRATYKGQTYHAAITGGRWVGEDGEPRNNPSAAARAITGNNVNGWRFWHALLPDAEDWQRMDYYKAG